MANQREQGTASLTHHLLTRLRALVSRLSPDTWAMLAVAGCVFAANLLYLLGLFEANPLGPRSELVSNVMRGVFGALPTIDPNNGFTSQALGHLAAQDLLHGHLPWWNPYEGTGMPLAGEMQSAAFFPPTLLTSLANGQLYEHVLLELVAGLATYLLLRRIDVSRWASAAAAIAFALNGTFAWFSHAPVNPVAFLPLLLLGIERAYAAAASGQRGGWWLISVAGSLSFYGGFPEVTYIDTLMAICWFGWRAGCLASRKHLMAFVGKSASGLGVATLLSAPLLAAMASDFAQADLGANGASSTFGSMHLSGLALPQLLLPYIYGPIFGSADPEHVLTGIWGAVGGYLTTSLALFALLGLFSKQRRGLRLILFTWTVLVFARMYGEPHVLSGILGALPYMSRVAFFRYATPSLELSVIVLAALGIDDLVAVAQRRRRVAAGALAIGALVTLAVLKARTLAAQLPEAAAHRLIFVGSIAWAGLLLASAVATTFALKPHLRERALALLLACDTLAMFSAPELSAPRNVTLDLAPVAFLSRHVGDSRIFTLGPLQPNYGSYFNIASLNVNDFPPSLFATYVHTRLDQIVQPGLFVGTDAGGRPISGLSPQQELLQNLSGYREAGVSYVLTPVGQMLPQSRSTFTLVFRSPSTWIYHLAGAASYFSAGNRACTVAFHSRQSARVRCPSPTVLTRRETAYSGWSATIDNRPTKITEIDGLFQAVAVGAGSHEIRFSYLPPNVDWAYLAFAAGVVCLLVSALRALRRGPSRLSERAD